MAFKCRNCEATKRNNPLDEDYCSNKCRITDGREPLDVPEDEQVATEASKRSLRVVYTKQFDKQIERIFEDFKSAKFRNGFVVIEHGRQMANINPAIIAWYEEVPETETEDA